MKLDEHIKQLEINGLTFIEKAFSVKECEEIKLKLDNIIDKFKKKKYLVQIKIVRSYTILLGMI